MRIVIRKCNNVLAQLRHYVPDGDDEEINIETAIELFEELLKRAERKLKLSR